MTQSNLALPAFPARNYFIVLLYAAGMAWVEATVVLYLRTLVNRIDPYQALPLPLVGNLGSAELVREAATLIMLLAVGWLAGTNLRTRIGYAVAAFGLWDILYYVFLKILCGWPNSVMDWDILFLLPLPWWGPVLAPVLIACLMIFWGSLMVFTEDDRFERHSWAAWACGSVGIALALYVFMKDALKVAEGGAEALRQLLPTSFDWRLFILALALMSVPTGEMVLRWKVRDLKNLPA